MSFTRRHIDVRFSLGQGQFGESGEDNVTLTGAKVSAQIVKTGGLSDSIANLRIWGLPLDIMNRLTVQNKLGYQEQRFNQVTILAGGEDDGMSVCFTGTISEAWADFNNMPDVCFLVTAQSGLFEGAKTVDPISFNGTVDIVTMLSGVAAQMKLSLRNNGVTSRAVNPYYSGSLSEQLQAITRDYMINYSVENGVLNIWPSGGAIDDNIRVISSETGLVGYPMFTQNTLSFKMLFDPAISWGQTVQVVNEMTPAEGLWTVAGVSHEIDSEDLGGGMWFTSIECGMLGHVAPLVS